MNDDEFTAEELQELLELALRQRRRARVNHFYVFVTTAALALTWPGLMRWVMGIALLCAFVMFLYDVLEATD